jgi:hypothetical protein
MHTRIDKTQENKNRSLANGVAQKRTTGKSSFQVVDQRPETITQRKLQGVANDTIDVVEQRSFQVIANSNRYTKQVAQLQQRKGRSTTQKWLPMEIEKTSKHPVTDRKWAKETLQLDRVSTAIGSETVTADRNANAADTLAFLGPGKGHGKEKAPVHLTKKITDTGAGLISAGDLTHAGLNAENADVPDYHFTVTSGFMAAALVNSPIKTYLVKNGVANAIWGFQGVSTADLSQNKLTANQIVTAFNSDLDLAQAANFDNFMFTYDPDGQGPTFDAVVSFHDAVKNTLFSIPSVNPGGDIPFTSIKYVHMRASITIAADALAAQWSNWTNGGDVATRNDFRIAQDKWTDLSKALNILNRIRAKALKLEADDAPGAIFDDDFVDQNLTAHANAKTAIKENMNTDQGTHAAEFT